MTYSKTVNGIIVSKVSASTAPEGYEENPRNVGQQGSLRALWDENWNEKPVSVLVNEGLIEIPVGFKLQKDEIVEMTEAEKIKAKIIVPTELEKIENGKIIPKTMDDLLKDGLVSAKDYNAYIVGMRRNAYQENADSIFWDYQEGKATKAEWLAAKQAIRNEFKKVKE